MLTDELASECALTIRNSAALALAFIASATAFASQTAPVITWSTPAPITFGTALSGAQLNASANVAGTFAYLPAAGTVPALGAQSLGVTFTPTDSADYTTAASSVNLTVTSGSSPGPQPNLYVTDEADGTISEIAPNGSVSLYASALHNPRGLVIAPNGVFYVSDYKDDVVFQIAQDGALSTFAFGTTATRETGLSQPFGIALDGSGNLYVADYNNGIISEITPNGNAAAFSSGFSQPAGLAFDGSGNLYVAALGNGTISKITPGGTVTQVATGFAEPLGLAFDGNGNLYISDEAVGTISEMTPQGVVTLFAGNLPVPRGLVFDGSGNLYAATAGGIIKITSAGVVSTLAPAVSQNVIQFENPFFLATNPNNPPSFTTQPTGQLASIGQTITLTAAASGSATYQWTGPNGAIAGATGATLILTNAQPSASGIYSVTAANGNGMTTSNSVTVGIAPILPAFAASPVPAIIANGRSAVFSVTATGLPAPSYQWTLNGAAIPGATDPILEVQGATSADAGSYACVASNSAGAVTSTAAALTVTPTSNPGHLINLSTRADVGTGNNLLIGGFVIGGTGTKPLLVRGVGPTLTVPLGGSGELATPQLTLLDVHGLVIASNIGWGNALTLGPSSGSDSPQSATGTLMDSLGAATYAAGSGDTAMVLSAPVGNSTAEVAGVEGTGGIALVEFYDADTSPAPTAHLINISARADVGTGNNILIGGFAVSGATSETVLIRAVGPGLVDADPVDFSLATVLNQPVLTLLNSSGVAIYSNTVWGGDATLANIFPIVGAFTLNPTHADSALLVTLPAGTYTAEVSGLNGGTGIALCEIYEVY